MEPSRTMGSTPCAPVANSQSNNSFFIALLLMEPGASKCSRSARVTPYRRLSGGQGASIVFIVPALAGPWPREGGHRLRTSTGTVFASARYGYVYGLMKRIGVEAIVGRLHRLAPMRLFAASASQLQIPFFELLRSRSERT